MREKGIRCILLYGRFLFYCYFITTELRRGYRMIDINEREFRQFADYIRTNYGIRFKNEKKTMVAGRLNRVMESMKMSSLTEYMDYVKEDVTGQAASVMLDRLTTNYTYFMREAEHFTFLKERVLPYLVKTVKDRDLRIWSAACSTGEEPYTLAMILDEFFGWDKTEWDTDILATDLSEGALTAARAGIYSKESILELPAPWRRKYFRPYDADHVTLCNEIRKKVTFGKVNLVAPAFPFRRKMHVIFCRNVMIYFDEETKEGLVQRLYDITEPGGFLFTGHSEGLNREKIPYRYVMPAVYRKEQK